MIFAQFIIAASLLLSSGPTRSIDESEIKRAVEKFVAARFDSLKQQYALEYRSLPTRVLNVPKRAALRVVADPTIELRDGVLLPVEVFLDHHVEHTFIVSIRVRTYAQVLLASDNIEKRESGESLAATEEMIETTTLPADVISTHESLIGKRAKRMIRRGTVLTESMFEPLPLINQGTTVTLIVKTNSVTIKTKAIVREDGAHGDVVLVQKEGSSEKLKARVLDEYTVELLALK